MLPSSRSQIDPYEIPQFDFSARDVDDFNGELQAFHSQFADCFKRSESRQNFYCYMAGQLGALERKSIEPIAERVEGGKVRALQQFISDRSWADEQLTARHHRNVDEDLGEDDAVLIFDESGFAKKGKHSIGVARQYCGSLGKVENCQVGVFAAYASRAGYALVGTRLFLPQSWFDEAHAERREDCELPPETGFKTKPQLAAELLLQLFHDSPLRFSYIAADCLYGDSPEFIEAAEQCTGTTYVVSIASSVRCWLQQPVTGVKKYKYKGENKTKTFVLDTDKKPLKVIDIAKQMHATFWYRRTVSEGTKGPIAYEFCRRTVTLEKHGLPWKTVTLIMKRTLGRDPIYSFAISNASSTARLKDFVWLSGMRWPIEQCFEECKSELGMAHYEVRKFKGWHHHMLAIMLAHFFLWHLKIRWGKKGAGFYAVAD
jgi:SRSO17 transposase